jgi:hypothetical protein
MEHRWQHVSFGPVTSTEDRPGAEPVTKDYHLFRCPCGEELYSDEDLRTAGRRVPCPGTS